MTNKTTDGVAEERETISETAADAKAEKARKRARAQKKYSPAEERFNIITHIFGAVVCAVFGVVMIVTAASGVAQGKYGGIAVTGVSCFTAALVLTYVISAVYHASPYGSALRNVMRRFDHCSIALLIAGSYLAYSIVGLIVHGTDQPADTVWGIVISSVVGLLAVIVIAFNGISVEKFKVFTFIAYIVMGWMIILRVYHLFLAIGLPAFMLLLGGGIAYTAGTPFYKISKIPFNHAIWHLFVLAGSVLMICGVQFYLL